VCADEEAAAVYVSVAVVLAPEASVVKLVGVTENWLPFVVARTKLVSACVPVLWTVIVQETVPLPLFVHPASAPLAVLSGSNTVPKLRLEGVTERPYWIPTPVSDTLVVWFTVALLLLVFEGMLTVAAFVPRVAGLNFTMTWQVACDAYATVAPEHVSEVLV
jgi:hypothetical protein